jgi:hypothetical protein
VLRIAIGLAAATVFLSAGAASASAPPVGKLPAGPLHSISVARGQVVALALPHRANGLVWRQASGFGSKLVRERSEGNVGKDVVVLFDTLRRGTVTIAYGLTRGDSTGAHASLKFRVTVK